MTTKQNPKQTPPIPALEPKPAPDKKKPDPVQQASEQSFPASDPPAHGSSKPADAAACEPKPRDPAPAARSNRIDKVDEASLESFPASDPPAGSSHA